MHAFDSQLRLLLATDLSERSDRAFDRALMLARDSRGSLIVLNIVDEALPKEIRERLSQQAHDFVQEQLSASKIPGQADVQIRIVRGRDYKTIIDQARDGDVHLVILGTHRADALIDSFVGATMDRVLRYGDRSVLVVKSKPRRLYRNILVATDFSDASRQALEFAIRLFPEGKFTVLYAHHKPLTKSLLQNREFEKLLERSQRDLAKMAASVSVKMSKEIETSDISVLSAFEEGFPLLAIPRHIENNKNDLVVVGTHGRSGWKAAVLGSVTQAVLVSAPCDVLAVRASHQD